MILSEIENGIPKEILKDIEYLNNKGVLHSEISERYDIPVECVENIIQILSNEKTKSEFFLDTVEGLLESIEITKSHITLEPVEGMPAETYRVSGYKKKSLYDLPDQYKCWMFEEIVNEIKKRAPELSEAECHIMGARFVERFGADGSLGAHESAGVIAHKLIYD